MTGSCQLKPFAVVLLEEHRKGKSVEELSHETGIPTERIEMRLKVAVEFLAYGGARVRGRGISANRD